MKLSDYDLILFDLDGTIYNGPELIDGAKETIDFFRTNNKYIVFGTNNSSKTRAQIAEKLNSLGIKCEYDEVVTSAFLAYNLAKKLRLSDVYVVGSDSLINKFSNGGIMVNQTESALNLVIGYDIMITYEKLTTAFRIAMNAHTIISCNEERNYPSNNNRLFPSCGGIVKAIEWCANRKSDYVVGKPNSFMIDYLINKYGINKKSILIVGDSTEFDVQMAKDSGTDYICIHQDNSEINYVRKISDIPNLFKII